MKVRKAIKNIVALGTGLTMLGATVFGAMATDLGEYPNQYISDGAFDGLMVVGARASTEDVLGIVDIATSLQFASKTERVVSGVTTTSLSGDVFQFGSTADMLTINEFLGDVKSTITSDDMVALESRDITTSSGSTDVDQYLKFNETAGLKVVFDENKENIVDDYLYSNNNDNLYTFELQFPEGLESDAFTSTSSTTTTETGTGFLNDLDEEELYILGETFSVVEVRVVKDGLMKLTMMGGAVTDTLKEGESRTYELDGNTYEVSVLIISDSNTGGSSEPKVKFMINGEVTKSLDDGDTDTLDDGTVIGIKSLLANEGSEEAGDDIVEFYLGANKVELQDSNYSDSSFTTNVEIDEESIDDATVKFQATWTGSEVSITSMEYRLKADAKVSGDLYIASGESLRDSLDEPEGLLSSVWDVKYEGLSEPDSSVLEFTPSADEGYSMSFTNQEGLEYSFEVVDNSNDDGFGFKFGDEEDTFIFMEQDCANVDFTNASIDIDDYFVVSDEAEADDAFTRVLTFDSVDTSDGILQFTDVAEGSSHEVQYDTTATLNTVGGAATTTDLIVGGESYDVRVYAPSSPTDDQFVVCIDLDDSGAFEQNAEVPITLYGGAILNLPDRSYAQNGTLGINSTTGFINVSSLTFSLDVLGKYTDDNTQETFQWTLQNATGNEVDLDYTANSTIGLNRENSKNTDIKEGMTTFGIHVAEDEPDNSDDADSLTITIPADQVVAQVFVTGGEATSSTSSSGNTVAEYTRIQVGKSVLDSEISSLSGDNLIVVGGPCANTVAAQILGVSSSQPGCYEDFPVEEGQGIIKMVENGDKVATLVAGFSAADTRKAAQVLANYEDYSDDLSGKEEVVVSGTKIMAVTTSDDSAEEEEVVEEEVAEEEATEEQ